MATVTSKSSEQKSAKYDHYVLEQLHRARKRIRSLDLISGLCIFLAGTLAYGVGMTLLDHWLQLPTGTLILAFVGYLIGAAVYLGLAVVRPMMQDINPYYAARKVEQTVPDAKNSVVNFLDLQDQNLPSSIRGAVGQRAAKDLSKADLEQAVSSRRVGWASAILGILVALLFILLFTFGAHKLFSHLGRAFAPFKGQAAVNRTRINLIKPEGGDGMVAMNQDAIIVAEIQGHVPDEDEPDAPKLHYRANVGDPYFEKPMEYNRTERTWMGVVRPEDVGTGFLYKVSAGDSETAEYRITLRANPLIEEKAFQAIFERLPYRGEPTKRIQTQQHSTMDHRELIDYRGTTVRLQVPTNRQLKNAYLAFMNKEGKTRIIPGSIDTQDKSIFVVDFEMKQSGNYRLGFESIEGEKYIDIKPYLIDVQEDRAPKVQLTKPGKDITLPANGLLELEGVVDDDIGIKTIRVQMRVFAGPQLTPKAYRTPEALQLGRVGYPLVIDYKDNIDLTKLTTDKEEPIQLEPGDVLEYWLEAEDACTLPQANVGKSPTFKVTIENPQKDEQKQKEKREQAKNEQQKHEQKQDQQLNEEQQKREQQAQEQEQKNEQAQGQEGKKGDKGEKSKEQPGNKGDKGGEKSREEQKKEKEKKDNAEKLKDALDKMKKEKEKDDNNDSSKGKGKSDPKDDKGQAKGNPDKNEEGKEEKNETGKGKGEKKSEPNGEGKSAPKDEMNDASKGKERSKPSTEKENAAKPKEGEPTGEQKKETANGKQGDGSKQKDEIAQGKSQPKSEKTGNEGEKQSAKEKGTSKEGMKDGAEEKMAQARKDGQEKSEQQKQTAGNEKRGAKEQSEKKEQSQAKSGPQKQSNSNQQCANCKGGGKNSGQAKKAGGSKSGSNNPTAKKEQAQGKSQGDNGSPEMKKEQAQGKGDSKSEERGSAKKNEGQQSTAKSGSNAKGSSNGKQGPPEGSKQAASSRDGKKKEEVGSGGIENDKEKRSVAKNEQGASKGNEKGGMTKEEMDEAARKEAEQLAKDLQSDDPQTRAAAEKKLNELSEAAKNQQAKQESKELAKGMQSNDPKERGQAQEKLDEMSKAAKDEQARKQAEQLAKDLQSDDPQTRQAAEEKLEQMKQEMNQEEARKQAEQLMKDLQSNDPQTSQAAEKKLEDLKKAMKEAQQGSDPKGTGGKGETQFTKDDGNKDDSPINSADANKGNILQYRDLDELQKEKIRKQTGLTDEQIKQAIEYAKKESMSSKGSKGLVDASKGKGLNTTGPSRINIGGDKKDGFDPTQKLVLPPEYRDPYRELSRTKKPGN